MIRTISAVTSALMLLSFLFVLTASSAAETVIWTTNKRVEYYLQHQRKQRFVETTTFEITGGTIVHKSEDYPHTYTIIGNPANSTLDGVEVTNTPVRDEGGEHCYMFTMDPTHHKILIEDMNFFIREYNVIKSRTRR